MDSIIYDPLEEYEKKYRNLHSEKTNAFFEKLTRQSGVDIEQNRETVRQYNVYTEQMAKLQKKLNWRRFFRVLMCITIILIPVVIWKMTPKIRALRSEIAEAHQRADELLEEARILIEEKVMNCLDRHISDWGKIKSVIKDSLGEYLWKKTKRKPMILPIIMEVS